MDKQKLLVIDDNAFNRQVINELFDAEFDVLQAGDGDEGLSLMRGHAPSLAVVLLDIVMPKKDGLDVLREMRDDSALRSIPVIVTSSVSDDVFRLKALELGAVDYISTPFNPMLAKLRVRSTLATQAYDRLHLQNEMLSLQRAEDADYRAVLEDNHTAVLEFDGQGKILRYDATIKSELAGKYDERQLLDVFREDGVAEPEGIERLGRLFEKVISDDDEVSDYEDLPLRRFDGAHSWYRARLLRKTDDATGEKRLVMSIASIDQQKREEEATRAQLIRALNAAESASAAKGEFMSRMSHEIRTPLNAIIGFVTLARGSLSNPERVSEYLAKTEFASRHLLSIINDVLDVSAIESGRLAINYESYNLRELINSVTSITYPSVHKKNIQFQIVLDSVWAERVMGDKMRVSQILINLLSNAVKFTPQNGSVVLTIRQRPANANRIMMDFEVKDDGVGMSREFLERLGRPFEQQDAAIAGRYGGSGLGLAITKKLVALMNGAMTVDSVEGRGSTFIVSIPADAEAAPSPRMPAAFTDVSALVIDRESMAAEQTRACFRSMGCQCDCASSGKDALALCVTNNYNLILMDWKLPDLDGRSIIEAIRQAVDNEPTIAIMAYDHAEIDQVADEQLYFVDKPIFPSSVLDLLLRLYGKYDVALPRDVPDDFQGKRLLLAEDNSLNMEIASRILSQMGFTVVPAANGQEACDIFAASAPGDFDAILMDVQMPVVDGYAATRRIRASGHPSAKDIPILAMTANAFSQDVADAIACGMNGHISKPIDVEQLRETLARHVI